MAGQGAKGGGQVAMPAAQAMGGSRGPMGPQGTLGGSPLGGQPPSAEMIANMGAAGLNVGMADMRSSLKNILADRNMTPEERAGYNAGIIMGNQGDVRSGSPNSRPIAFGQQPRPMMFGVAPPIEGTAEAGGVLGGTARAGGGLMPNQGLPMPSGGLKGGIFGQQPRPMPQPSQAQYAPLAPQGQFNVNQAAAGALQQAMGATQQGLGFTPMGIRPTAYRPSQIAGTSLAPYTNPYESQVVQQTLRDIGTAQEQALNLQGAQAQRANAFGGSRQGIAEAETRLGYGRQALDAASRLRQQGYQTALGLAGQDVGAQTAAAQYAAQQRASAQAQNLAAQQAAMGTRLGAAQQLAGLGQQAFGTGQAIQQQQMQQGLLQQMLQQSLIDAAKAQYAGYTGAPQAALAAPLAALGATPSQSTTTTQNQAGLLNYIQAFAGMR